MVSEKFSLGGPKDDIYSGATWDHQHLNTGGLGVPEMLVHFFLLAKVISHNRNLHFVEAF